jgi:hypothetical protein
MHFRCQARRLDARQRRRHDHCSRIGDGQLLMDDKHECVVDHHLIRKSHRKRNGYAEGGT